MRIPVILMLFITWPVHGFTQNQLPVYQPAQDHPPPVDWLVHSVKAKAGVYQSPQGKDIILWNGLIKRTFRIGSNLACTGYENLYNGQQLLRAVKPEAMVTIDGVVYHIGGLYGQKENAYLLNSWVNGLKDDTADFHFTKYTIRPLTPLLPWKPVSAAFHTPPPASGIEVTFEYSSSQPALKGIVVTVCYALYDGLPLLSKWLQIDNSSHRVRVINRVVNEILAVVEEESAVVGLPEQMKKQHGIYMESDYAFNNSMRYDISDQTTHWKTDSSYTSQVNYNYQTPCLLENYPEKVTAVDLSPGEPFTSVRSFELLMDGYDRERRGLSVRKMYRALAPWTLQNPLFMHLVSKTDDEVKQAIDQCRLAGYDALIMSFGSHCNMEDTSASNITRWKTLADYAHSSHVLIGSYSLFSSRSISDEDDVIDSMTGRPGGAFFGHAPCYGSRWGLAYAQKIKSFLTKTGFNLFENDGPYPGDVCASATHPGHKGLGDSQWKQMLLQKDLYHWCAAHGIYVNAPDWYFLDGTNKIALGYREVNFSLPRDQQRLLNRQNIFDGTWEKTGAMSWGFVPLTKYQGGGSEAVLEPLSEHLDDYTQLMMQYYGAGVQACYRGPRLYDSEVTRQAVAGVVSWYRKYFAVLNADMIHLRRADGRNWDGWMHVDPGGKEKALAMLFNPLKEPINRKISLPLYYTGLTRNAAVTMGGKTMVYELDRNYSITVTVSIPPESYTWLLIK